MKKKLKLLGIVALAVAIGFSMTGCPTSTDDGNGDPPVPVSVTITPASAYVGQGGRRQFTATVGPEGAPQAVTWSVAPTGAGTITAGGLLTVTGADVGDTLLVTATAVNHPAISNTAAVTVPEPISITVTGISTTHPSTSGEIELRDPETGTRVASGSGHISGSSATFTLWDRNWDHRFAVPGDYEVSIRFGCCYECDGEHPRVYRIALINITAGTNTIPWSAFSFVPPITVTVTGIPSRYQGDNIWGFVAFMVPGTTNEIAGDEAAITGASTTFTLTGIVTGTYDVFLAFMEESDILGIYNVSARNITTSNTIPFNQFAVLPPSVTITVTGIPVEYRNGFGEIELVCAETGDWFDWGWSATSITGSSAAFRFWFTDPGLYDVLLWVQGSARWGEGIAPARNITATTTIPWSAFDFTDGGENLSVTVTGIPERYHGDWGDLDLYIPGTSNRVARAEVYPVGSSTTFRLRDVEPGTYDVVLWLNDFDVRYTLPSRNITAGASIPFNQFTLSPQGFSEHIERSERVLTGRSNARSLRTHR